MPYRYAGSELEVFAHATNWKRYLQSLMRDYLTGDVLEVGAGIGGTTRMLCDGRQRSWTCLEPDPTLAAALDASVAEAPLPIQPRLLVAATSDVRDGSRFDAVLYIDVLEHIEDDGAEMARAAALVRPGGAIVVLAPAHPWLFTAFDARIGHFRRYTRAMLQRLTPEQTAIERLQYVDSAGMIASCANKLLLRSDAPTLTQIRLWDRVFVSASRRVDPILGWRVGKSVLGVWRRM
jgi:SAM-dependent methyltransferase